MEKEMHAIVKWTEGKDAGKYTIGINVHHIKDFNYDMFQNDDYDEHQTFPVEWRKISKMPLGGWEVYEAEIIAVADSMKKLEKIMHAIDVKQGEMVTNKPRLETNTIENSNNHKNDDNDDNIHDKYQDDDDDDDDDNENQDKNNAKQQNEKKKRKLDDITNDNSKNAFITKGDLDKFASDIIGKIMSELSYKKQKTTVEPVATSSSKSESKSKDMKILKADDKEIQIPYSKWDTAKKKNSFTSMTWALILAAFDEKVLRVSNYKGGAARRKNNDSIRLQKLDENIITVIKVTVKKYHPSTYNETIFGNNINIRLNKLRNSTRNDEAQEKINEPTDDIE